MIVSCSRLNIEFKENGRLYLSTESKCRLTVSHSCRMEVWTSDRVNCLPLRYEYVGDMGARCMFYYIRLHHRYYNLMRDETLVDHDIVLPSSGYSVFYASQTVSSTRGEGFCYVEENEKENRFVSTDFNSDLFYLNQYGSNEELMTAVRKDVAAHDEMDVIGEDGVEAINDDEETQAPPMEKDVLSCVIGRASAGTKRLQSATHHLSHLQLSHIQVYFKDPTGLPRFKLRDDRNKKMLFMTVTEDTYAVQGVYYSIYGLCLQAGSPPLCHFIISENRKFIVFIPVAKRRRTQTYHHQHHS